MKADRENVTFNEDSGSKFEELPNMLACRLFGGNHADVQVYGFCVRQWFWQFGAVAAFGFSKGYGCSIKIPGRITMQGLDLGCIGL